MLTTRRGFLVAGAVAVLRPWAAIAQKNPLKDGRLTVPTGPGLGLELDEMKLREMRLKE